MFNRNRIAGIRFTDSFARRYQQHKEFVRIKRIVKRVCKEAMYKSVKVKILYENTVDILRKRGFDVKKSSTNDTEYYIYW